MVENSDSLYLNISADCQEAFAYIQNPLIEPEEIYVSVPFIYKTNYVKLINPSNLAITFEWICKSEKDIIEAEFIPKQGTLEPRSDTLIRYNITYHSSKIKN